MRIGIGMRLGNARGGGIGGGGTPKYAIVVVTGASNQAGGAATTPTLTAEDSDATGRVQQFRWDTGTIENLAGTIYRPGGALTTLTTPAINFAKAYAATLPASTKVLIVLSAVGGRGVYGGGTIFPDPGLPTPGDGPWNPDGPGPAYVIGGSPASTGYSGSLYLAQAGIKSAVYAACEAIVGVGNVVAPIFYGSPMNENDTAGPYPVLLDRTGRAITGVRTAWGNPTGAWVTPGVVPEFGYAGTANRPTIDAVNKIIEERLANYAFVTGEVGFMDATENIHYTNPGLRALGTRAFGGVAIATARTAAIAKPVDWLTGLGATRCWGFLRGIASYGTGPAFELHNGTTAVNINFLANGEADWAAALAHSGAGSAYITKMYDHMGSGTNMVPEGTQALGAQVITSGNLIFSGKRPTWGNDLNLIMLKDTAYSQVAAGAILAVGRFLQGGNKAFVSGPTDTLAMTRSSGNLQARSGATWRTASVVPEAEPAWIGAGAGYNTHAHYIAGSDIYIDGVLDTPTVAGLGSYVSTSLGWGGIIGTINRYGVSRYTQLVAWDTAPTGGNLTAVQTMARRFAARDAFDMT